MNPFQLYLAEFSEGIVKVGVSRNADQRASQIETYACRQFGADMRNFVVVRNLEEAIWRQEEIAAIESIRAEAAQIPDHQEWFRGVGFGRAFELCLKAQKDGPKVRKYTRNAPLVQSADKPMTARQTDVLSFVLAVYRTDGRAPSIAEIAKRFGCNPNASVCVVDAIVRKGYLVKLVGARGLVPTAKAEAFFCTPAGN